MKQVSAAEKEMLYLAIVPKETKKLQELTPDTESRKALIAEIEKKNLSSLERVEYERSLLEKQKSIINESVESLLKLRMTSIL